MTAKPGSTSTSRVERAGVAAASAKQRKALARQRGDRKALIAAYIAKVSESTPEATA